MLSIIKKELKFGANNYKPINVCIKKAAGIYLTDVEDKKYIDFVSGYSAVNHGHNHKRLVNVAKKQLDELTLTSRAMHNNLLGEYAEKITKEFNYDKVLPMNTGVEAGETAIKIARKWGYEKKQVEPNKAINLFCNNNFWGRTISACSSSSDPICYTNFGPYNEGFKLIDYDCIESFEECIKQNPNIVSIMLEPIQGEAGIIIPENGYLKKIKSICEKNNILMIADEVQTGMGRTGKMLACDYDEVKPDILVLGKALGGGIMPVSAVLADNNVMEVITPGTHGSTFGGNPLGCRIAMESIDILKEEHLIENAYNQGVYFRETLNSLIDDFKIKEVRGRGLLNAVEFYENNVADRFSKLLLKKGIIAKTTHDNIIRFSPPLIINRKEIDFSLNIINDTLKEL